MLFITRISARQGTISICAIVPVKLSTNSLLMLWPQSSNKDLNVTMKGVTPPTSISHEKELLEITKLNHDRQDRTKIMLRE